MASILLFTDFGTSGPYLGQVQAVLAEYAPSIPSYLLLADAPMFKPKAAGYLLAGLLPKLPPGSVVLSVVDPGVGTSRRALAMVVDGRWIIGPDNGLLDLSLARGGAEAQRRGRAAVGFVDVGDIGIGFFNGAGAKPRAGAHVFHEIFRNL